ncbi:hypothetical protein M422DRAFT_773994 [Sphaerobolus stellatus SS14]|nr:hypothetical protein M422DRAFT_773994 [Sphaerobolus stellatus SS14]
MPTPHISNEVFEMIVGYVDLTKDLLNVALICKSLYKMVIPHHTHFRELEIPIEDDPFFGILASRPNIAANVRHLTIEPPRSPFQPLPPWMSSLAIDDLRSYLTLMIDEAVQFPKAVAQMHNLETFSWLGSLPSSRKEVMYDAFEAISSCLSLKSLAFRQAHKYKFSESEFVRCPLPMRQLPFLTALALRVSCTCESCQTEKFYEQILTLPNLSLQDVHLSFRKCSPSSIDYTLWNDLFKYVHWPALIRFSIQGTRFHKDDLQSPVFGTFLQRHPNLKALALLSEPNRRFPPVEAWPLFPNDLPESLQYLHADGMEPKQLLSKKFGRLLYVNTIFDDTTIRQLKSMPMLKYCNLRIRHPNVKNIARVLPNVMRLNLTMCSKAGIPMGTSLNDKEIQLWAAS